jgi:hypothetical protein
MKYDKDFYSGRKGVIKKRSVNIGDFIIIGFIFYSGFCLGINNLFLGVGLFIISIIGYYVLNMYRVKSEEELREEELSKNV